MPNRRRVYLDCCCLGRIFDDRRQERVRLEHEAIITILAVIESGFWELAASEVLIAEILRNPVDARRSWLIALARKAECWVSLDQLDEPRIEELRAAGLKYMDAAHLVAAEAAAADVFLTVDDDLLRKARRLEHSLSIEVDSPLPWLARQDLGGLT